MIELLENVKTHALSSYTFKNDFGGRSDKLTTLIYSSLDYPIGRIISIAVAFINFRYFNMYKDHATVCENVLTTLNLNHLQLQIYLKNGEWVSPNRSSNHLCEIKKVTPDGLI